MSHKIDSAAHVFWALEDSAPDGSRLYLRIPRDVANGVKRVRLSGPRRSLAVA